MRGGRGWTRWWALALGPQLAVGCAAPDPKRAGGAPVDSGQADSAAPLAVADPTAPTGSQAVVASAEGRALTSALVDEGAVVRVDLDTGERSLLVTGAQPTRVARFGGAVVVSLRGARALAVLSAEGPLVEERRVEVGAEPVGLVAARDGGHLYVALYGSDEVVELDAALEVTRRFAVGGRPSWLALHPGGRWLAVGSQVGGLVSMIDLSLERPVPSPLALPGVDLADPEHGDRPLTARVTGDLSFSDDGAQLAAPLLYVDNLAVPKRTAEESLELDPADRYERIGLGMSPNNPMVALWSTLGEGAVDPASVRLRNAVGEAPTGVDGAPLVARSFLSSVVFSSDGALVMAPMESGAAVVALPADPVAPLEEGQALPGVGGLWLGAGAGARGLAVFAEDDVWVYNFIDTTLQQLPAEALRAAAASEGPVRAQGLAGDAVALLDPADGVQLSAQLELGRRLFYSGTTPTITTPLSGVSCATCHFESRNDGLSWMEIDGIGRQTLSLAGPMSETAPFTWNNDVATVADEVEITSQARLGGRGGTQEMYEAVAAYIESTPEIDHALRGARSAAADRGAALFADPEVGCASCHRGPRFTDQQPHDLYGLEQVDTPSLVGVATTAPYLHDGSAQTLRAVLEGATAAGMGDLSGLDEAALSDLEAYLRTL